MRTKSFCMVLVALSTLGLSTRAVAQADRGAIKGEVQDSQKANVAAAKITLREESTGVSAETVAGDTGQFSFLNLLHGVYTLTVSAPGFHTTTQTNVVVNVGRTIGVVVTLQPGEVTESVNVNGTAAAVDTQTSDVGTVVNAQEIKDLPVNLSGDMRNPLSFVTLTPGVSGSVPGATPDYRLHISGSASFTNDVYIDGIPVSNTDLPGNISANHPPIDAVSEFKLINNNESAQYGLASGIVSFAFKSGTNAFHGSLFEFLQNEAFNAAGAVFDALRPEANCVNGGPACKKPGLKQHEFGGTFGGPVRIPKLYNGRDKTFFFVDFTDFKYRPSAINNTLTTIPNAWRAGDFSQILGPQLQVSGKNVFDPAGRPVFAGEIYDPLSVHTVTGPDGNPYQVRDPFVDAGGNVTNIIPAGYANLSQVSQQVLKFFPVADNNALQGNLARTQSSKIDQYRFVAKIDEHISDKQTLSGSVLIGNSTFSNNGGLNLLDANTVVTPTKQLRATYNYTHSPTLINNLNVGVLRDTGFNGPLQAGPGFTALGVTGLPPLQSQSPFPQIGIGTLTNSIGSTVGGALADAENRYIVNDNVTLIRGNHSFTFGGEVRRLQRNNSGIASGSFVFEPTQSGLNGTGFINGNQAISLPAGTGNPAASFLFGGPDYTHVDYPIAQYYRWWQTGGFMQDDWRVRSNLTLNLGLRYDLQVPRTETRGDVSSMDPTLPNPSAGGLLGAYSFYGSGPGRNGKARIGNVYRGGFQPRIGFAYSPGSSQKTAFRGGFAITRPLGNDNIQSGFTGGYDFGFAGIASAVRPGDVLGSPAYFWDNPYPANGVSGANLDPGLLTGNDNPVWIGSNAGLPPTQLYWTTQIERQLSNSVVVNIGYVGMHTYHLGTWSKPNQINPAFAEQKFGAAAAAQGLPLNQFLALSITDPRAVAAGVTAPWPGFVTIMGPAATVGQSIRPFPQYGSVDHPENPIGSVSYNGLQASLQKRYSQGLTFLLSYTYSKAIGDVDSNQSFTAGAENAIFAGSFFQDYYNPQAQRSVTSSDIPHVLSLAYTYELPFGKGKQLLNHGGVVNEIVGGWSVSGIQKYQSGRPIHIEYDAFGASNPYNAQDGFSFRPNVVPGQPLKNPNYSASCSNPALPAVGRSSCQFYINPAAFAAPPPGQFGDAPNLFSSLRMPWYLNEDLSISKRFLITETMNLQFQANFFNAFNRVLWSASGASGSQGNAQVFIFNGAPPNLDSATLQNSSSIFGIFNAQQNNPRIIQFGLKLEF
ncbi:MAG: carboxypeptidase regulatory-like domain-containing protein [Terriglobales bacterium]